MPEYSFVRQVATPSRRHARRGGRWALTALLLLGLAGAGAAAPLWLWPRDSEETRIADAANRALGALCGIPPHDMELPALAPESQPIGSVRVGLRELGAKLTGPTPLSFAGVLAEAGPAGVPPAAVGHVYFLDGAGVYAVEVGLAKSGGDYALTHFWDWERLDIPIQDHSAAQFNTFRADPNAPPEAHFIAVDLKRTPLGAPGP